jgi:hypothetical protein
VNHTIQAHRQGEWRRLAEFTDHRLARVSFIRLREARESHLKRGLSAPHYRVVDSSGAVIHWTEGAPL